MNLIFIWGNWVLYIAAIVLANLIPSMSITREIYGVIWRVLSNPFHWMVVITTTAFATIPIYFIQSIFTTKLPGRSQNLRDLEVTKASAYEPSYFVDLSTMPEDYVPPATFPEAGITIWEVSHSLFAPLCELLGCRHGSLRGAHQ